MIPNVLISTLKSTVIFNENSEYFTETKISFIGVIPNEWMNYKTVYKRRIFPKKGLLKCVVGIEHALFQRFHLKVALDILNIKHAILIFVFLFLVLGSAGLGHLLLLIFSWECFKILVKSFYFLRIKGLIT